MYYIGSNMNNSNNSWVTPFMILTLFVGAFAAFTYVKIQNLEKGTTATTPTTQQPQAAGQQPVQPQVTMDQVKGLFDKALIKFGDKNKKLLMVEVSDPSCPYCHAAAGKNKELSSQIGPQFKLVSDGGTYIAPVEEMKKLVDSGKASMVWLYQNGHGNGELGTKAMYCAFEKGKFWQVHDLLMSNAGYEMLNTTVKNDKTKIGALADFLGKAMNSSDLKSCLESGKYDSRLTDEAAVANSIGVQGTPGFYLNTTNFAGAYSWTDMKTVADAALK